MREHKRIVFFVVVILAAILLLFLMPVLYPKDNPWLDQDTLTQILSEDNIRDANHFYYAGQEISITPELSEILQPETWTRVEKIEKDAAEPILTIQYTKFEAIKIYATYACLEDKFVEYGQKDRAYYVFSADFSRELTDYLENCEEVLPYK